MDEIDFIFQLGNLKRTKRSGWLTVGITDCESVAEHSFRAAALAYIIAMEEGLPRERAQEAAVAALMHDVHEARIGDVHKLGRKYMKIDEKKAVAESLGHFAKEFSFDSRILGIAKDADLLEMFFQAKEYCDEGNKYAKEWLSQKKLKTKSAKRIYGKMLKRDSRKWILGAVEW